MKFRTIAAVLAATMALSLSAEMKLGMVDLMTLVKNHPNYESNKTLLTATDKDYQKKLDVIKAEGDKLQEDGKKLMEQMRNPMLAAKAKSDAEKELTDLQQKLMALDQRYRSESLRFRQELQDLEGRLLKTTTDDLRKRIAKFASSNGYDLIVEKSATAYAAPALDVTNEMLKELGVDPAEAAKVDEGK